MELEKIQSAFNLSSVLKMRMFQNLQQLFALLTDFNKVYENENEKLPYHINLIDELHADENAHSRIFAKLLRYRKNNRFLFLENFLHDVCGFEIHVANPKIEKVDSCGRIDIPIFDKNYVVLIENKVTDKAPDQNTEAGGQLARYIETIKNSYNRIEEEIFVVYTPKYSREPSDDCWVNKDGFCYKENFKTRFKSVSYRDDIYPWLKEKILTFEEKDIFLQSSMAQYIDYLEGLFSLRTINETMNIKLQDFLKEQLNLQDIYPQDALEILSDKERELNNALAQIQLLKLDYLSNIVGLKFNNWKQNLSLDFPTLMIVEDDPIIRKHIFTLGVIVLIENQKFSVLIECIVKEDPTIYIGISPTFTGLGKNELPDTLLTIMSENNLGGPEKNWYGWKYTSISNAYYDLKTLIEQIIK